MKVSLYEVRLGQATPGYVRLGQAMPGYGRPRQARQG
jgi:hypothetical protein